MKRISLWLAVTGCLLSGCCGSEHFLTDKKYREKVGDIFEIKKALFADTGLFSVFNSEMTQPEREAMTFLYAYMPIGDIADYDGDFYLKNVRSSFEVRKEMPWGKEIPEMIFRHFVLPVRVNNENLDESRMVFYEELKDRIKGLSLYDAVLEVNHWCHEKVIYAPSDSRTSSPLASVRSAYGRCGEESTFTVAALRSAGIPARQVYTPRWAHTDDNHAWVEAWVDGKWYFMGACEPEPVLNLGWFNAPAYRGMLMHTKVFGNYNGPEEVMEQTACYTEINVIDNYAPSAKMAVTVKNADGTPAEGALVEFKLYNYAEFYSVARKTTDQNGTCSLTAGKGDMLLWVTKDGRFGYRKISFGKEDRLTVVLDKIPGDTATIALDIVPPAEGSIPVEVSEAQKEENARRLQEEDRIRNQYVATFHTEEKAKEAAKAYPPGVNVGDLLIKSRGNCPQIEKFLRETPDSMMNKAISLLHTVSAKDLRDTPAEVFADHLNHTPETAEGLTGNEKGQPVTNASPDILYLYHNYVLNPRIANELLSPYKGFFAANADKNLVIRARKNPQALVEWVKKNIEIRDDRNPQRIPILPAGVRKARIADTHSRNIFFVAMARSMGIPARIEPVTKKVQYYHHKWVDADFRTTEKAVAGKGYVTATYPATKTADNPRYYSHFTIASILPDARLQTLDFHSGSQIDMGSGTQKELLRTPTALDEGNYLLVTGTRMASGKVLAHITFFPVKEGDTTAVHFVMREDTEDVRVIGNINAEAGFNSAEDGAEASILQTTGRGYFIIGILGARQEPTNHAMRDIAALRHDFEAWNRGMVLLFANEQGLKQFDRNEFGDLPSTITYGIDTDGKITKMITEAMKINNPDILPVFIIADTFGRVVFVSQGYTIGLGEQMMKVIHKL
jgi:transglutaminase-like putative cysteine protease